MTLEHQPNSNESLLVRGLDSRGQRIAHLFEIPILIAALMVIPAILIEVFASSDLVLLIALVLNWVIWMVFATEFTVLTLVATDRRAYVRSAWLEILIIVFTFPPLTALAQSFELAGLVRLTRLARLTRFGAVMVRAGVVVTRIFSKRGLAYIVSITVILAIGFGVIFGLIEESASVGDGIWWAIVTITTVGYGDFFPLTMAGRIVAGLLMIVGIGFVATLTATVAAHFMDDQEDELREEIRGLREQVEALSGHVQSLAAIQREKP